MAELDSCITPTSICLYQVKKKDRKEWTWNELTKLKKPSGKRNNETTFRESPLGKLFATVIAFRHLKVRGIFISNSGCDVPLSTGKSAATSLPLALNYLSEEYKVLIKEKMLELSTEDNVLFAMSSIYLEKIPISPDDPKTFVVGFAHQFLEKRSPRHAGQARSLVEALIAIIGALGTRTYACNTFEKLCCQHGFSRAQFSSVLGDLEGIPDVSSFLDAWLEQLGREGMGIMETTSIKIHAAAIFRKQIIGHSDLDVEEKGFQQDIDTFLRENDNFKKLKPIFEHLAKTLHPKYPYKNKHEIMAYFAIKAIKKCADQI